MACADTNLLRDRLVMFLAGGRARHAERLVGEALECGVAAADFYDEILAPAMRRIGELWARGVIGIGAEHLAAAIADRLCDEVARELERRAAPRPLRILLACPEGESHGLGLRMAFDVLDAAGHDVLTLGLDAPTDGIVGLALAHRVDVVGLSLVLSSAAVPALAVTRELGRLGIPVVAGGQGAPAALTQDGVRVVREVRRAPATFAAAVGMPSAYLSAA